MSGLIAAYHELLHLAAIAGGYSHYEYVHDEYRDGRKVSGHYCSLLEVCLNPITCDDDAFRLMVSCGLCVSQWESEGRKTFFAHPHGHTVNHDEAIVSVGVNDNAAARFAIVMAAARLVAVR